MLYSLNETELGQKFIKFRLHCFADSQANLGMPSAAALPLRSILDRLTNSACKGPDDYDAHRSAIAEACEIAEQQIEHFFPTLDDFRFFLRGAHDLCSAGDSPLVRTTLLRTIQLVLKAAVVGDVDQYVKCIDDEDWHWVICLSLERAPLMEKQKHDDRRVERGEKTPAGEVVRQDFVFERMGALKLIRTIMQRSPHLLHIGLVRSVVAVANSAKDNIRRVCVETLRELCLCNAHAVVQGGGVGTLHDAIYNPAFEDMIGSIINSLLYMLNNPETRKFLRPYLNLRAFVAPFADVDADDKTALPCRRASRAALVAIMRSWAGIAMLTSDDLGLPTLIGLLRDPNVPSSAQNMILDVILEVFDPIFARVRRSRQARRNDRHFSRTLGVSTSSAADALSDSPDAIKAKDPQRTSDTAGSSFSEGGLTNGMSPVSTTKSTAATTQSAGSSTRGNTATSSSKEANEPKKAKRGGFFSSLFGGGSSSSGPAASSSSSTKEPNEATIPRPVSISAISSKNSSTTNASKYSASEKAPVIDHNNVPGFKAHGTQSAKRRPANQTAYVDLTLYNALDNYAAFLCCAFLHADTLLSLTHLGTHGDVTLAFKARWLLVELLRSISHILPDEYCAELLNMPSLLQFSSLTTMRAHKASEMLELLADAFTVAPRDYRCSPLMPLAFISNANSASSNPSTFKAYQPRSGPMTAEEEARNHYMQFAKVGILGSGTGKSSVISICAMADHMVPLDRRARARALILDAFAQNNARAISYNANATEKTNRGQKAEQNPPTWTSQSLIVYSSGTGNGAEAMQGEATFAQIDAIRKMRSATASSPAECNRLLDLTKVNGKEGKEPFRWSWDLILDLLVHEFGGVQDDSMDGDISKGTGTHRNSLFSGFSSSANSSANGILTEAMKSKWVRRMCGFYRCSTEEKGYFANLTWEPSNLNYLECAILLYQYLVDEPNGQSFLRGDRRGMLYNEIAAEVKSLITIYDKSRPTASFLFMNRADATSSVNSTSHAFRRYALQGTLSREYFSLVGHMLARRGGQGIIDETDICKNLLRAGHIAELDYFSRVVITSLVFADKGYLSKHLINAWTSAVADNAGVSSGGRNKGSAVAPSYPVDNAASGGGRHRASSTLSNLPVYQSKSMGILCSMGLQSYILNLLGVLLHARPVEFQQWGMDAVVNFVTKQRVGHIPPHLIRLLLQIVQRVENLVLFIDKLNDAGNREDHLVDITVDPSYKPVLIYFLTVPQGLQYLRKGRGDRQREGSYLTQLLDDCLNLQGTIHTSYVKEYEVLIAKALSSSYMDRVISPSVHIKPLPYFTKDLTNAYRNQKGFEKDNLTNATAPTAPRRAPDMNRFGENAARSTGNNDTDTGAANEMFGGYDSRGEKGLAATQSPVSSDVRITAAVELEGLLKLPWNMEVKSFLPKDSYSDIKKMSVPAGCPGGEYLPLDVFLDTSDLVMPATNDICADKNRFVKVRGLVLDDKGNPSGRPIKDKSILAATLLLGACPVNKKGEISPAAQGGSSPISFEQARKNAATNLAVHPARRASVAMNSDSSSAASNTDEDVPPTYLLESLFDWTMCRAQNVGLGDAIFTDISDSLFSVEIPGEPCKFIFSKDKIVTSYASDAIGGGQAPTTKRRSFMGFGFKSAADDVKSEEEPASSDKEALVYLLEVQYYISIRTGQSPFAVVPPHPCGMLVRSEEGTALLSNKGIIRDLITVVQAETAVQTRPSSAAVSPMTQSSNANHNADGQWTVSYSSDSRRLKAALWALGHISSTDSGFDAITTEAKKLHEIDKEQFNFLSRRANLLQQLQPQKTADLPSAESLPRVNSSTSLNTATSSTPRLPPAPPKGPETFSVPLANASGIDNGITIKTGRDSPFVEPPRAVQPAFPLVEWCVYMVSVHPNYSVRATIFSVLGLISRSSRGKTLLSQYDWESSSHGCSSAVTVPKNASSLFTRSTLDDDIYDRQLLAQSVPEALRQQVAPLVTTPDMQVLQLLAKMNGASGQNILGRIQNLAKEKPDVFKSRDLFANVMRMFSMYSFSLQDRRGVVALFHRQAKMKES